MASARRNKSEKSPAPQDAAAARPKGQVGMTSKLSVRETWIQVFEENEVRDEADRRTDAQISEFMKSEFPGLNDVTFDRVEIARGKYNRGGFHKKDKNGKVVRPKVHSKPHGADADSGAAARADVSGPDPALRSNRVVSHQKDFKSHKK